MYNITRNPVSPQFFRDLPAFSFREISDPAHPETERPQRRHGGLARQTGIFIQNLFRFTEENKNIRFVIPQKKRHCTAIVFSEITGHGRGSMHKYTIPLTAHEKGNRFVHGLVLCAVRIIGPQYHFLTPFIEFGKRFSAAEYFFIG